LLLVAEQRSDLTDMRVLGWEWNGNIDEAKRKKIAVCKGAFS
jgi:hypothetical protein